MTYVRATTTQAGYAKKAADVGALTDNSGGTANDTVDAAGALYSQSDANNTRADFAAKFNAIRTNLRNADQMA